MSLKKIFKGISTVMVFSLAAKLISFFVELLVATKYGATKETDVYYMVMGIIQIIYPMISVGIWKVFMPEYKTRSIAENEESANQMTDKLIILFLLVILIATILIYQFPTIVLKIFAPGFTLNKIQMAIPLLRILVFMFVFNCIATFSSAILQSKSMFSKSQIKEVLQYVPPFFLLLFFSDEYGIKGLAIFYLIGALLSSVIEYLLVRKIYRFRFPLKIFDKSTISILKQVPVACLNSIINQVNNIIDKAFSSGLAVGSVTCLTYGSKLIHLFDGIFSTAVSTAIFPYITEMVAKNNIEKLRQFMKRYMLYIAAVLVPLSSFICLESENIVGAVFGYGKFDNSAINLTALVLLLYGIGLVGMCYTTIVNDILFITKRLQILLITTIINIISNVIFDVLLVDGMQVAGLSLATTISLYLSLGIKIYVIREMMSLDFDFLRNLLGVVCSAAISSLLSAYLYHSFVNNIYLDLIISFILFITVYTVLLMLITSFYKTELKIIINKIWRSGGE